MKKAKKYIYPFIFSICFFVTYIILVVVLEAVLPSRDYAGLAYVFIALIIWISVIIPIFCLKYCKLIREEKLKFLFAVYNPLVIALCHTGPFFNPAVSGADVDILISIAAALFVWVAIWTFVPLVIRLISTEKQEDNISNELQE